MHNATYIKFGLLVLFIGFFGLAYPFIYSFFLTGSPLTQEPIPAVQAQLPTFEDSFIGSNEDMSATPIPMPTPSPKPLSTSGPVSASVKDRLIIGNVNIDMPIFLGDTEKTLNKGGWLFPAASRPDKGGNSVIFGHRYMYRPPKQNTFWNLDKVKIGDVMVMYWKGKEYKYKVFEIKIVEPTDLSVIQPSSDSRLTVITCTPLFTTKQRLVVTGSLIAP